jgi:cysteine desulfurase
MKSQTDRIHYFDYNATHPPIVSCIVEANEEYFQSFYNPSGATRFSLKNQGRIETIRNLFSDISNYPKEGIVFSSTGTEANYLLVASLRKKFPNIGSIYTSHFEHSSFYAALEFFNFKPKFISSLSNGQIDVNELETKYKDTPLPVGIIYAANETGVIQPIDKIRSILEIDNGIFISDSMQAFGKIIMDFNRIDGFSCSGHKIGAGPGSAATGINKKLYAKEWSLIQGGNQENNHRAGTENLPSLLAFQKASEFQLERLGGQLFTSLLFQREIDDILEKLGCKIIGKLAPRLPNTIFAILPIDDLDFFMMGLEEKNILISTGSSCKSRAREASESLLSMGYSKEEALRAVRISFGMYTTREDVKALIQGFQTLLKAF